MMVEGVVKSPAINDGTLRQQQEDLEEIIVAVVLLVGGFKINICNKDFFSQICSIGYIVSHKTMWANLIL